MSLKSWINTAPCQFHSAFFYTRLVFKKAIRKVSTSGIMDSPKHKIQKRRPMNSVHESTLKSNTQIKINFDGGDLSSDGGLLLVKEFIHKLGFDKLFRKMFQTNDTALFRIHTDVDNLLQSIYLTIAGYFEDDRSDDLNNDPVLLACLEKEKLASQPTVSRFFNRMDDTTLTQFENIQKEMRNIVYHHEHYPDLLIFDLDSTLLPTYGNQEGEAWNHHYQADGYHPLLCFDGVTGDLIKMTLRDGTDYSCNGVGEFLEPVLEEFKEKYPSTNMVVRGDSGFATPELYDLCEKYGAEYTVRLKNNPVLFEQAKPILDEFFLNIHDNLVDYAVSYGEFIYQANTWSHPRRVVCKIEKPANSIVLKYTFVVTTRNDIPERCIEFYCERGNMENFIKEGKDGFDFSGVSSQSKIVNANRLAIAGIAYNIYNWMKRLTFPESMLSYRIHTARLKLFKTAAKVVRHSGNIIFKLCSSCPYKDEFFEIISNIRQLEPSYMW